MSSRFLLLKAAVTRGLSRKAAKVQKAKFDHAMAFARSLLFSNPDALFDVVRLLLRPMQSELMLSAIESGMHASRSAVNAAEFFMPSCPVSFSMSSEARQLDPALFEVHLNRDTLLPCPWHRERYKNNLAHIGAAKGADRWHEDVGNHAVEIWLPWGLVFVRGGNHSIAAGIVAGEGVVIPKSIVDMGSLLDSVDCDGLTYRAKGDGRILDTVENFRVAAVFEIGRLMREHAIMPMKIRRPA